MVWADGCSHSKLVGQERPHRKKKRKRCLSRDVSMRDIEYDYMWWNKTQKPWDKRLY